MEARKRRVTIIVDGVGGAIHSAHEGVPVMPALIDASSRHGTYLWKNTVETSGLLGGCMLYDAPLVDSHA